jgi:hypothetical protein
MNTNCSGTIFSQRSRSAFSQTMSGTGTQRVRCVFVSFRENIDLYERALIADAEFVDVRTRLYWQTKRDEADLRILCAMDKSTIEIRRHRSFYRAPTGHTYRLALR